MSVTSEINSSANYLGSAALGGYAPSVIDIDTTPLAELAKYTMLYNKAEYEQRQKDTNAQIAELAKISEISLNDLYESDKEQFIPRFTEYQKFVSEWARKTPKTQAEKLQHQLEYQTKTAALKNDYTILKTRAIQYQKELGDMSNGSLTAEQISFKKKDLDERMRGKDIYKPLEKEMQFNFKIAESSEPITMVSAVNNGTGDFSTMAKVTSLDYVNTNRQNSTKLLEIQTGVIPETIKDPATGQEMANPNFPTDPILVKEQRKKNLMKGEAAKILDRGAIMNDIIKAGGYVVNGVFDEARFLKENTDPAILKPYYIIKAYQENAKKEIEEIKANRYVSKGINGVLTNMKITPELLAAAKGFDNGTVTELQLLNADSFNKLKQAQNITVESKETGLATQNRGISVTAENNRMTNARGVRGLELEEQKIVLDAAKSNLKRNSDGSYSYTVKVDGKEVTGDYAEDITQNFITTVGASKKFGELTVDQQKIIKDKIPGVGDGSDIIKDGNRFKITYTIDGKTETDYIDADGYKKSVISDINASSEGTESGNYKISGKTKTLAEQNADL